MECSSRAQNQHLDKSPVTFWIPRLESAPIKNRQKLGLVEMTAMTLSLTIKRMVTFFTELSGCLA